MFLFHVGVPARYCVAGLTLTHQQLGKTTRRRLDVSLVAATAQSRYILGAEDNMTGVALKVLLALCEATCTCS